MKRSAYGMPPLDNTRKHLQGIRIGSIVSRSAQMVQRLPVGVGTKPFACGILPRDNTVKTLTGHTDKVGSVAFSPDGTTLASGSLDGKVFLWETTTGQRKKILTGHTDEVYSITFSPDGRTLASGSWDKTLRLWDATTGQHKKTLTGHTGQVYCIAFSPDGTALASGGIDGTVLLWDLSR